MSVLFYDIFIFTVLFTCDGFTVALGKLDQLPEALAADTTATSITTSTILLLLLLLIIIITILFFFTITILYLQLTILLLLLLFKAVKSVAAWATCLCGFSVWYYHVHMGFPLGSPGSSHFPKKTLY